MSDGKAPVRGAGAVPCQTGTCYRLPTPRRGACAMTDNTQTSDNARPPGHAPGVAGVVASGGGSS